jgi:ATP synthase F1 gamma subunit
MKNPRELLKDQSVTGTLVVLTGAFEGISSTHLAKIKNQVLEAGDFFDELWNIYSQLRVDSLFHFGRSQSKGEIIDKELYLLITGQAGFSGDIDQKLIRLMLETFDSEKQDIVVVGRHGASQLAERDIKIVKYFKLPTRDQNINVTPLVDIVQKYRSTTLFYEKYTSLTSQTVESMQLSSAVQAQGSRSQGKGKDKDEVISEVNYIFEPSVYAVVDHLESTMLHITISQLILDSKLAQYASRFKAMTAAHLGAEDTEKTNYTRYRQALRSLNDERSRETINSFHISMGDSQ